MKKTFVLTLIILISLMLPYSCKGALSVQPLELWIVMDDEFINGNTLKKIMVTNNDDFSVNFTWYIDHPSSDLIRANRTLIPSLSWVDIEPKWHIAQPGDTVSFYIYLDIPENEEYLSQHWETWPTFKQNKTQGMFELEQSVRLYIDTPLKPTIDAGQDQEIFSIVIGDQIKISLFDLAIVAIMIILLVIGILVIKKKKS